jgi:hypothetical protein
MPAEGRRLLPRRPWATNEQATVRVVRLAVVVVASQFYLNALAPYLPVIVITLLWVTGGTFAAIATFRFESYMTKNRRSWS